MSQNLFSTFARQWLTGSMGGASAAAELPSFREPHAPLVPRLGPAASDLRAEREAGGQHPADAVQPCICSHHS